MREIKFRGRSRRTGNWVYGVPAYGSGGPFIEKICTYWEPDNGINYEEIEVDSKTIGEFTGLKDKNGNDIYEGDIIRQNNATDFVVTFLGCCFVGKCLKTEPVLYNEGGHYNIVSNCEIIGNTHYTPSTYKDKQ